MASFVSTTVTGNLTTTYGIRRVDSDMSNWYQFFHCADAPDVSPSYAAGWIHVRTPIPATVSGGLIANIPVVIEVSGYHTYSGEYTHNFKLIITVNSGDTMNAVVRGNLGNDNPSTQLRAYQSSSLYGGTKRLCFAMPKMGCCCNGWFWVRFRGYSSFANSFPFATTGGANLNSNYY
jgi:hypothetical protein